MLHRLGPKLIVSLTVLIVLISSIAGYLNLRTQKKQLADAMVLGADQLSPSITSATWHAMLDDHREAAYEIMRVIAHKQGIDRIRMFNREGRLVFPRIREKLRTPPSSITRSATAATMHPWPGTNLPTLPGSALVTRPRASTPSI